MNGHDDLTDTTTDASVGDREADRSQAAARLLEVAAHNAEELLAEAQAEADQVRASAREEADQLVAAARAEAQRVRSELEGTRAQHTDEIARLQDLEQDYRDRMRGHLTDLLAQIERRSPG